MYYVFRFVDNYLGLCLASRRDGLILYGDRSLGLVGLVEVLKLGKNAVTEFARLGSSRISFLYLSA